MVWGQVGGGGTMLLSNPSIPVLSRNVALFADILKSLADLSIHPQYVTMPNLSN